MLKRHGLKKISIEITDKCYLSCKHCSTSATSKENNFLTKIEIERLLKDAKIMGAKFLTISGGEPLLHGSIWDILNISKDLNFKVSLYSSGVLKKDNKFVHLEKELQEKIRNYNNVDIIFSLYSNQPDVHDYITNINGSYELVLKSIRIANSVGLQPEIHTVPMSVNYKQLSEIINLAEELRVEKLSLLRLVFQGRCVQYPELLLDKKQIQELCVKVKECTNNTSAVKLRKGAPFKCIFLIDADSCTAGEDKILIGPDGSVHPCEAFKTEVSKSNIRDSSLQEIWEKDPMLNELRDINYNDITKCNSCVNLNKCQGGCPGQRWLNYKNFLEGPDPICIKAG